MQQNSFDSNDEIIHELGDKKQVIVRCLVHKTEGLVLRDLLYFDSGEKAKLKMDDLLLRVHVRGIWIGHIPLHEEMVEGCLRIPLSIREHSRSQIVTDAGSVHYIAFL